ncbi:MAG TPA: glycine cleavage system aminomethyltransferase GcvT [Candidatus Omnitrophota bacterium]|nr:glycine cleavage system aminomethyltransferase GcvT [Candidatus Omnitrophota bacterium]HPS19423.1 glycine cleavage system aminomethyltransferase GcvT [Candidatus Omnitrophota bacterium]
MSSHDNADLKRTPLYEEHVKLNARMVPFAGWEMPVQYPQGIIEEHLHTRTKASIFDICHMGEFIIGGPAAFDDVNRIVTCRIDDLPDGKARYGFLLNEKGAIIDDLIVFRLSKNDYMLVVNGGTIDKDAEWVESQLSSGTHFRNESESTGKIDVQGPLSTGIVQEALKLQDVSGIKRFSFRYDKWEGVDLLISCTGYTGEKGYELFMPAPGVKKVWERLLEFGDLKPAGLGARDSLRLEMGYSLYGHDIDDKRTPVEAGLERFVHYGKDFIGKPALLTQKEKGTENILSGFICEGRRAARDNFNVIRDGKISGRVTSGVFSPCLKLGIGLCYIKKELSAEGTDIQLGDTDGKIIINAKIKKPPFVQKA